MTLDKETPADRDGNWITLASGRPFYYLKPTALTLMEVAVPLSNICRFTGHTKAFYSVAQHSVFVSRIVPPEYAMWGLMHDAAEAVMGDMNTLLKMLLPAFKVLEKDIERVVHAGFGLHGPQPPIVKWADLVALATERRDLMPDDGHEWPVLNGIYPHDQIIVPLLPNDARDLFVARFMQLCHDQP